MCCGYIVGYCATTDRKEDQEAFKVRRLKLKNFSIRWKIIGCDYVQVNPRHSVSTVPPLTPQENGPFPRVGMPLVVHADVTTHLCPAPWRTDLGFIIAHEVHILAPDLTSMLTGTCM